MYRKETIRFTWVDAILLSSWVAPRPHSFGARKTGHARFAARVGMSVESVVGRNANPSEIIRVDKKGVTDRRYTRYHAIEVEKRKCWNSTKSITMAIIIIIRVISVNTGPSKPLERPIQRDRYFIPNHDVGRF